MFMEATRSCIVCWAIRRLSFGFRVGQSGYLMANGITSFTNSPRGRESAGPSAIQAHVSVQEADHYER